jgi:hypothetical protein
MKLGNAGSSQAVSAARLHSLNSATYTKNVRFVQLGFAFGAHTLPVAPPLPALLLPALGVPEPPEPPFALPPLAVSPASPASSSPAPVEELLPAQPAPPITNAQASTQTA